MKVAWRNIPLVNQLLLTSDTRYTYRIRKTGSIESPPICAGTSFPSIVRKASDLPFKADIALPFILPRKSSNVNHREFKARGGQAKATATSKSPTRRKAETSNKQHNLPIMTSWSFCFWHYWAASARPMIDAWSLLNNGPGRSTSRRLTISRAYHHGANTSTWWRTPWGYVIMTIVRVYVSVIFTMNHDIRSDIDATNFDRWNRTAWSMTLAGQWRRKRWSKVISC